MSVRPEIAARLRRAMPKDCSVIEQSLPVISFGDAFKARVATVALNPSWREFWDSEHVWRDGEKRRLESLRSLGLATPEALSDEHVEQAILRSDAYFAHQPYKTWFNPLNTLVRDVTGADYYDGSACHLDLVQWATATVQKDLGHAWDHLVEQDKEFLLWQLETTSADTIIMNGKAVVEALMQESVVPQLESEQLHYVNKQGKPRSVTVYSGRSHGRVYVGWNVVVAYGVPKDVRGAFIATLQQAAKG